MIIVKLALEVGELGKCIYIYIYICLPDRGAWSWHNGLHCGWLPVLVCSSIERVNDAMSHGHLSSRGGSRSKKRSGSACTSMVF